MSQLSGLNLATEQMIPPHIPPHLDTYAPSTNGSTASTILPIPDECTGTLFHVLAVLGARGQS